MLQICTNHFPELIKSSSTSGRKKPTDSTVSPGETIYRKADEKLYMGEDNGVVVSVIKAVAWSIASLDLEPVLVCISFYLDKENRMNRATDLAARCITSENPSLTELLHQIDSHNLDIIGGMLKAFMTEAVQPYAKDKIIYTVKTQHGDEFTIKRDESGIYLRSVLRLKSYTQPLLSNDELLPYQTYGPANLEYLSVDEGDNDNHSEELLQLCPEVRDNFVSTNRKKKEDSSDEIGRQSRTRARQISHGDQESHSMARSRSSPGSLSLSGSSLTLPVGIEPEQYRSFSLEKPLLQSNKYAYDINLWAVNNLERQLVANAITTAINNGDLNKIKFEKLNIIDAGLFGNKYKVTINESALSVDNLPPLPDQVTSLYLSGEFKKLPLLPNHVDKLFISHCPNLTKISTLPGDLKGLNIVDARNLRSIKGMPNGLMVLTFDQCRKLSSMDKYPVMLPKDPGNTDPRLSVSDCDASLQSKLEELSKCPAFSSLEELREFSDALYQRDGEILISNVKLLIGWSGGAVKITSAKDGLSLVQEVENILNSMSKRQANVSLMAHANLPASLQKLSPDNWDILGKAVLAVISREALPATWNGLINDVMYKEFYKKIYGKVSVDTEYTFSKDKELCASEWKDLVIRADKKRAESRQKVRDGIVATPKDKLIGLPDEDQLKFGELLEVQMSGTDYQGARLFRNYGQESLDDVGVKSRLQFKVKTDAGIALYSDIARAVDLFILNECDGDPKLSPFSKYKVFGEEAQRELSDSAVIYLTGIPDDGLVQRFVDRYLNPTLGSDRLYNLPVAGMNFVGDSYVNGAVIPDPITVNSVCGMTSRGSHGELMTIALTKAYSQAYLDLQNHPEVTDRVAFLNQHAMYYTLNIWHDIGMESAEIIKDRMDIADITEEHHEIKYSQNVYRDVDQFAQYIHSIQDTSTLDLYRIKLSREYGAFINQFENRQEISEHHSEVEKNLTRIEFKLKMAIIDAREAELKVS